MLSSNSLDSLRREYKDAIRQHSDASDAMKRVYVVLINIALLAGCTPASVGEILIEVESPLNLGRFPEI
jgi:hypothetical protein